MKIARVLLASLFLSSCRTAALPDAAEYPPLAAQSQAEAWQHLVRYSEAFRGARMLARFRGRESFRAVIDFQANGELRIQALSPVGTTAAIVEVRGETVHWRSEGEERTAPISELGERLLGVETGDLHSRDLAMLLLGLPPAPTGDRFTYELTSQGLRSVRRGGVTVTYQPAVFPPRQIRIDSPGGAVQIDVLELVRL